MKPLILLFEKYQKIFNNYSNCLKNFLKYQALKFSKIGYEPRWKTINRINFYCW